jgi:hypothetical protein
MNAWARRVEEAFGLGALGEIKSCDRVSVFCAIAHLAAQTNSCPSSCGLCRSSVQAWLAQVCCSGPHKAGMCVSWAAFSPAGSAGEESASQFRLLTEFTSCSCRVVDLLVVLSIPRGSPGALFPAEWPLHRFPGLAVYSGGQWEGPCGSMCPVAQ